MAPDLRALMRLIDHNEQQPFGLAMNSEKNKSVIYCYVSLVRGKSGKWKGHALGRGGKVNASIVYGTVPQN